PNFARIVQDRRRILPIASLVSNTRPMEEVMRIVAMISFAAGLLCLADAHATTQSNIPLVPTGQAGLFQLAGSFHSSPNKLNDKYLSGLSGGYNGIGGSEPKAKYFKSRMPKIPRCCANSR